MIPTADSIDGCLALPDFEMSPLGVRLLDQIDSNFNRDSDGYFHSNDSLVDVGINPRLVCTRWRVGNRTGQNWITEPV